MTNLMVDLMASKPRDKTTKDKARESLEARIRAEITKLQAETPATLSESAWPWVEEVRQSAEEILPRLETGYLETGNPLFVWKAVEPVWFLRDLLRRRQTG